MLTETAARWLLVLHTALGVAAVGAATHLVLWVRRYLRGDFTRHAAVRRFAWWLFASQAAAFLAGNLMYPTYKVEVRTAYLENATAVASDYAARARETAHIAEREGVQASVPSTSSELVTRAAKAARWFDVKEHWVALGLFVTAALVLLLAFWDPRRDGGTLAPVVFGLAIVVAGTLWLAAVIGVLTAAWRAV